MDNTDLINNLYKKYRSYDPFILCDLLNIEVMYVNFNRKPLGQAVRDKLFNEPLILLDNSLKDEKQKFFVCAHELCHILTHKNLSSYYVSNKLTKAKLEVESNYFAVKLATAAYEEEFGYPPNYFDELNNNYGVPLNFIDYYF